MCSFTAPCSPDLPSALSPYCLWQQSRKQAWALGHDCSIQRFEWAIITFCFKHSPASLQSGDGLLTCFQFEPLPLLTAPILVAHLLLRLPVSELLTLQLSLCDSLASEEQKLAEGRVSIIDYCLEYKAGWSIFIKLSTEQKICKPALPLWILSDVYQNIAEK